MPSVRHMIVEDSSSSVDNGGAGTVSYHTLYLPHATQETVQKCLELGRHSPNVQRGTLDAFDERRNQEMFL